MAHFVLEYRYSDMDARARVRAEHLAYMSKLHAAGKVVMAGPVGDSSDALVLYRADDEAEVRRLVDADPYTSEGVCKDITIRHWNVVVPGHS